MGHAAGEAARLSGQTVHALHHYDRIGLLTPAGRTPSGYRDCSDTDLERQHRLATERIDRLRTVARALEHLLEADTVELDLTAAQRLELFGDFDVDTHTEQARRRWGSTPAWEQSCRRTGSRTAQDWQRIKDESDRIYRALAHAMDGGAPPDGPVATDLAQAHRDHITRWFYDCAPEVHRGLGRMYVEDPRFTAALDTYGRGLSAYLCAAFAANADRREP
ncbi:TipAS antibiotic-recognition domain-containing protein [Nocardiopsis sp. CNT312]|uniref:MerR family transcriptional regulator n=1 Tax=Nocardiopsis sp. CNT312 TaxID=1137268 RepID=UPI00048B28A1|nr:TipAS antibiotic-recognition domain-containing protein [Nocardiopsis sp. CNT312]